MASVKCTICGKLHTGRYLICDSCIKERNLTAKEAEEMGELYARSAEDSSKKSQEPDYASIYGKDKWYEDTAIICCLFFFWCLIIPPIIGALLLSNKTKKERQKNEAIKKLMMEMEYYKSMIPPDLQNTINFQKHLETLQAKKQEAKTQETKSQETKSQETKSLNSKNNLYKNPYINKYKKNEIGIDNVVYLLYCDYSDAFKWVKDCKKPDTFFSNYDKATQILEALISYRRSYRFSSPTPMNQLQELKNNYDEYAINFITNYWNTTLKSAEKLKTEKGKQNKIQSFFNDLDRYSNRFTPRISTFVESLNPNSSNVIKKEPKILKCGKYTLSTVADIYNIPNSDAEVVNDLQKSATDFKRNEQMDMAIACLRKSNEISDHEKKPLLLQKNYFRLVRYLEYAGLKEEAVAEEQQILKHHPEFLDKRISNLTGIEEAIRKNMKQKNDLLLLTTSNHCPICSPYNNKVYSISGKSKKYPKLPKEVIEEGGFCPDCYAGLYSFFDGISTPPK